jgi:hypothetical protein
VITPTAAIEAARQGLSQLQLADQPDIHVAISGGNPGEPRYVARLDQADQGYYLVPWQQAQGITAIVLIDAQTGSFSSLATPSTPQQALVISRKELGRYITAQSSLRVTAEPKLVWQPCRETASPFLPLYRVPTDSGPIFVGMNGVLHQQLTPLMQGGG